MVHFHLRLGSGADTGHRKTDVNGGTDTTEEEFSFQENLTIGNGNDIGRDVGRDITTLGFNDGQSSERSTTELVVHLGSTLEETRVEVEHITRVGLTTRRTTKEKRHLTVGNSLLGQIIIDNQS